MPPRKRRRVSTARGPAAAAVSSPPTWRLPSDILLEITARSDTATLIRCAALCKILRRDMLHPEFVRRVCDERDGIVPAKLLLGFIDRTFLLVHPATPATVSLAEDHLAPFVSRSAAGLLEGYRPLTSRGGLVLLERRRRSINTRRWSERRSDMCVYDPMTNTRAFLPLPPALRGAYECRGGRRHGHLDHLYSHVLLTAADGIGRSFMLVAADIVTGIGESFPFRVQTVSSDDGGEWGPVIYASNPAPPGSMPVEHDNGAVFINGVVHWLMILSHHILTYNVGTSTAGLIRLPVERLPPNWRASESCLGSSPNGKLRLLTMDGLRVSVWLLSRSLGGWTRHAEVDMEPALCSLLSPQEWGSHWMELESSGDQRNGAVLLRLHASCVDEELLVLDMETMETSRIGNISGLPFEVNLSSRLSAMQIF